MIRDVERIKTIDVLYRVSSIGQEKEGESLHSQRRSVETLWAEPRGIDIRKRLTLTESGKSALKLKGAGFEFNRRAEYTDLIVEYQSMPRTALPDAICIDWTDRWNRSPLELLALIEAFTFLGIRLLSVGDDIDLTDPRQKLITTIKSAVAGEQIRVQGEKVRENQAQRRARAVWQGGHMPDGLTNHRRGCEGLKTIKRPDPDGVQQTFRVRACDCAVTVLERDPAREAYLIEAWRLLRTSPESFHCIAMRLNHAGFRTQLGRPLQMIHISRLCQNPAYAGLMAYDRYKHDPHDNRTLGWRHLLEQTIVPAGDTIPEPFISPADFWDIWHRRFDGGRRTFIRRGSAQELYGIVYCPECERRMPSYRKRSKKYSRSGRPRVSPPVVRRYMICRTETCSAYNHRGFLDADRFGPELMACLASIVRMDDDSIAEAMQLRRPETADTARLERQRTKARADLEKAKLARHVLFGERAAGRLTQGELETELFSFRKDESEANARLRNAEHELSQMVAKPTFGAARDAVTWLKDRWAEMLVLERAEALRLLVNRVTYDPETRAPIVVEWGPAFRQQNTVLSAELNQSA